MQIIRKHLYGSQDQHFESAWELYCQAFPQEERRPLDYQLQAMEQEMYHAEVLIDELQGHFLGILFWWDLGTMRYVEHFATLSELRGQGVGASVLTAFIKEASSSVLLEVEHPADELSRRRIGFYERLGFVLNPHTYTHPPYWISESEYVSLQIMTAPQAITEDQLALFVKQGHPLIHFRHPAVKAGSQPQ